LTCTGQLELLATFKASPSFTYGRPLEAENINDQIRGATTAQLQNKWI
jgi:hypothetical protein